MPRPLLVVFALVLIAAGCSDDDSEDADSSPTSPTATFDGTSCEYDGPAEFDAGSEVTFTLIDTSDTESVGFGLWALPEGMTAEEILEEGISNNGSQLAESAEAELTDSGIRLTFLLADAGLYAVNCADRPDSGPAADYASLITVRG